MNKVILTNARLGKDPELSNVGNSQKAVFSVATSEKYKNKNGETVENTDWHSIEAWGKQAEVIAQYFKKGDAIGIVGQLKTDSWKDKAGVTKYRTYVKLTEFEFVSGGSNKNTNQEQYEPDLPF